jgi:hypothetical protein
MPGSGSAGPCWKSHTKSGQGKTIAADLTEKSSPGLYKLFQLLYTPLLRELETSCGTIFPVDDLLSGFGNAVTEGRRRY